MRTNVSLVATVMWRAVLSIILVDTSCRSFPSSMRSSRQVASWEALLLLAGVVLCELAGLAGSRVLLGVSLASSGKWLCVCVCTHLLRSCEFKSRFFSQSILLSHTAGINLKHIFFFVITHNFKKKFSKPPTQIKKLIEEKNK